MNMLRKAIFVAGTVVIAAVLVLATAPSGWAQANQQCQDFRALWQGSVKIVNDTGEWGGPVVAVIGDEVKEGMVSTIAVPNRVGHGKVGMDKGTQYLYDFGGGNTFVLELQSTGVFPSPPGKSGFGYYRDVSIVTQGTGVFANASGNIAQSGPYLVWIDNNAELKSTYFADIHGRVCTP
jgi:hypothetical protein